MTPMHATDEDLLRYVTDDLPLKQAQALEAHVCECVLCHSRLREQAELEVFCSELSEQLQSHAVPKKTLAGAKHFGSSWRLVPVAVALLYLVPGPGSVNLPAPELVAGASTPATSTPARPAVPRSAIALAGQKFMKFPGPFPALTTKPVTRPTPNDAGLDASPCTPPCSRAPLC